MELLLKINTWAMGIALVCSIITIIWMFKSRGKKPSKRIQRGVSIFVILVEFWRLFLYVFKGSWEESAWTVAALLVTLFMIMEISELVEAISNIKK